MCFYFRYFTRPDCSKKAKDALIKELEEAQVESEPPEKVPCVEPAISSSAAAAAPPPPGTSSSEAAAPVAPALPAPAAPAAPASRKSWLMKEFDQILEESEDPSAASSSSIAVQAQTYFSEKTVATSEDPYKYWEINKQRFPDLAAAARKYLCAPCTSVESERLFSTVSNIMDDKRNRLGAEKLEMLAFLSKNLPVVLD